MTASPSPSRRRLVILLLAVGIVGAVVVAIGLYGLIAGPGGREPDGTAAPSAPATPTPTVTGSPGEPEALPRLPQTSDAVRYARAAAEALFTWDTLGGHTRDEYLGVLLADADPSGYEAAGLAADLRGYLPSAEVWQQLREYGTVQHLEDV